MKQPWQAPTVQVLGTVEELTAATPGIDKCSGSGDAYTLQELSPNYQADCP